ncbi:MAG: hypothetical protein WBH20_15710 [Oceanisphaera sp.]|uniref:hypothetical protein n=1 Tax=Oceanisphaera sp. TaxID=1929979 RepID=UPI003C72EB02
MQLDEFVKSALVQVAKGVHEASEDVSALGGAVNPLITKSFQGFTEADATDIKFDVALIVSESLTGEAGAKISVASFFRANGSVKDTDSYQQTSRVQFSVPLRLPSGEDKAAKNAKVKVI